MGLLGDEAQVEAWLCLFGDRATLDARLVHDLRQTYRRLRNSIGGTRWNSYLTWVRLKIVIILTQDRCMV
jgi:hypothetical protein